MKKRALLALPAGNPKDHNRDGFNLLRVYLDVDDLVHPVQPVEVKRSLGLVDALFATVLAHGVDLSVLQRDEVSRNRPLGRRHVPQVAVDARVLLRVGELHVAREW